MSDCCTASGLMSLDHALDTLRQGVTPVKEVEAVSLGLCDGRILATDVTSPLNVPPHNNSAMDGYAMRAADLEQHTVLPVAGQSFAGHPYEGECPTGHCIRIMTGAAIPTGTDTVIMQEKAEKTDNGIRFSEQPKNGANVRRAGEDISQGKTVLTAGHRLRPQDSRSSGLFGNCGDSGVPQG